MSENGYAKLIQKYENYRRELPEIIETHILDETAAELQNKVKKRIFDDGLDADEDVIASSYSTKPITVEQKVFVKTGAFKGKKTMKLQHGYKELRDIQGLPTNRVNLDYSGALKNSLRVVRSQKSVVIGIIDRLNGEKAKKIEEKYETKIFAFTQTEIKEHFESVVKKFKKAQRNFFYGKS